MSPAVLDRRGDERVRQSSLFDERRSGIPGRRPTEAAREPSFGADEARSAPDPRLGGDRLTLEARLERIWEGLLAAGAAECAVCAGELERTAHGGKCRACGSVLS